MKTRYHLIDILIFLLIGILWCLNWSALKFLLTEIEPRSIRAISYTAAALLMAIAALLLKQPLLVKKDEPVASAILEFF